jgi:VWFA-related protein
LLLLAPSSQQETYRFEVEVRTVYVDVFVKRDGGNVTGLTAEDFEVLDSGVRQEIDLVDLETIPMTGLLMLDTSGSVHGRKLAHMRSAAHAFLNNLGELDEAGLVAFSYRLQHLERPSSDFKNLHRVLNKGLVGGPTSIYDSLYAGLKVVETSGGRPLILMFTDGIDNASWLSANEIMKALQMSEAVVHVVGIRSQDRVVLRSTKTGTSRNSQDMFGAFMPPATRPSSSRESDPEDSLRKIAQSTGGRFLQVDESAELEDAYLSILDEMKNRYVLSYQPAGVPEDGWHPLEVKVKKGKADEVRSRPGYLVQ